MMRLVPQGCVFKEHQLPKETVAGTLPPYWRDFYFLCEGEPSKESGLKRGDTFVMSCVRNLELAA